MPCNDLYKAQERFVLFARARLSPQIKICGDPKGITLMKLI